MTSTPPERLLISEHSSISMLEWDLLVFPVSAHKLSASKEATYMIFTAAKPTFLRPWPEPYVR
jgi:hypothetical protein